MEAVIGNQRAGKELSLRRLAEEVVERAEKRLQAKVPAGGVGTAVLAPGLGGILMHEIVGHALEADALFSDSWLAGSEDQLAPRELTVIDDPRRGRAPCSFDDEGERTAATPLLREGRVAGSLQDQSRSRQSGCRPTGHGRRASYRDPILPRMGCTFVAAGPLQPEEVVQSVGEGIYVRRMEAAYAELSSGRAVVRLHFPRDLNY